MCSIEPSYLFTYSKLDLKNCGTKSRYQVYGYRTGSYFNYLKSSQQEILQLTCLNIMGSSKPLSHGGCWDRCQQAAKDATVGEKDPATQLCAAARIIGPYIATLIGRMASAYTSTCSRCHLHFLPVRNRIAYWHGQPSHQTRKGRHCFGFCFQLVLFTSDWCAVPENMGPTMGLSAAASWALSSLESNAASP